MSNGWLAALLALALLGAGCVGVRGLGARSPLQRRLFLYFVTLSWVPAIVVVLVYWRLETRHLSLLQSPGLQNALESSLALARDVLHQQQQRTQALADSLAAVVATSGGLDTVPPGTRVRLEDPVTGSAVTLPPGEWIVERGGDDSVGAPWVVLEGRPALVARAHTGLDGRSRLLLVARPVDPVRAGRLDATVEGITRFRQVGLVYTPLLRAETLVSMAGLTLLLLLASLVLAQRLARRIGEPIRELAQGTRRVAAGDLRHEVRVAAVDEVRDLVEAFNRMTRELHRSKQDLMRSERIAAWQGVARRLAHEIKNPLTPIHLSIHRLRSRLEQDPLAADCLDTVLEETENLRRLADEFSLYARLPEPRPRPVPVRRLLEQVVALYGRRIPVVVTWEDWTASDVVWADEGQIRQVLSNVVKNALEAMGPGGRLTLRADGRLGRLRIEIEDDGPGLPPEAERVFEPDFTTKSSGSGLGLAIARKILEDHGGGLTACPGGRGGSVFVLEIPLAEETGSG